MIVLLTALSVEHDAVRDLLTNVVQRTCAGGTIFEVGELAAHPGRKVALSVTGTGALPAATLTERALTEFKPTAVLFVGIAGGLCDWLEIGDVVVATKIQAYQGGRSEDDEFLIRPNAWLVSHELEQIARRLPRDPRWRAGLPTASGANAPAVHFEAVAAGDIVLNSRTSAEAERIRRSFNDAVAIEMESAGFAQAGHLHGRVSMATIRAISDRADGTKSTTDSRGAQRLAATSAAAFATALAAAINEPGEVDHSPRSERRTVPVDPGTVHNSNVNHNGWVGAQLGVNTGNFRLTWPEGPHSE
ncbi:5'-methylthioadenosine/S-adenosylhomocysteine nucleosidase family protein [Frankia gtarii]|uniref:5'-methylthioadenosine/S-adenosylhomocysteine nucleosidase family protein n=1 Tax=Frankia gtarii TaxID=2950102 RepID=UPI0021C1D5F7|nr:5'-methylthioadenosine/S-adenosylhomocysteine nucleosidase [Frankia gtarii]